MDKIILVIVVVLILIIGGYFTIKSRQTLITAPTPTIMATPTPIVTIAPGITPTSASTPTPDLTPTPTPTTKTTPTPTSQTNRVTISIQNFTFVPANVTIKASAIIRWVNQDSIDHEVRSSTFDSGVLGQGESFEVRIDNPGTYDYICALHAYMKGKIIVQ